MLNKLVQELETSTLNTLSGHIFTQPFKTGQTYRWLPPPPPAKKKCSTKQIIQFSSVAQLCPTLCDQMNCSMPGLPVHHQLPEFTQTHVHQVGDAIQPSHSLWSLLLLPPIPPSIRVFSNASTLCMR